MFGCDDENCSECLKLKVIQNQRHGTVQNVKNGEGASPYEHGAKNRLSQNNFSITSVSEMCYSFTVTCPPVREITCRDVTPEMVCGDENSWFSADVINLCKLGCLHLLC